MAENQKYYNSSNFDKLEPADRMKIERSVSFNDNRTNLSQLTALPAERLQTMREESAAAEQKIFENLGVAAGAWEHQAAVTMLIDKAIEYIRTPPVKHTSNKWEKDDYGYQNMSNMVYKMDYHIYENTRYDSNTQKSVPTSWDITWNLRTNTPGRYSDKIAGQNRKHYTDKSEMEKYLAGRIKAYAHLFTEISPPIPNQYADTFRVNGQLLPGYTLENEEFTPHERAAEIQNGGDIISKQKNINKQRKETKTMNEPLNIQLSTHENKGSAWLKLPATAEQLNAVLARIGAHGGEQGKDFYINAFESRIKGLDFNFVASTPIDELNYMAARLQTLDAHEAEKLNALSCTDYKLDSIQQFIDYADNHDFFVYIPEVTNNTELGDYYLHSSLMIQMPEEWKGAVNPELLGTLAAANEGGRFCEMGYVLPSGDDWDGKYNGREDIPQEYRITPKPEKPEMDYHAPATNAAVTEETKPPEKTQTAAVIPIVLTAENPREKLKEITGKLEAGIKEIFESDKYKNYLQTLSKFHNYSFNNCLLIAMQKPDASRIAGFNDWRDNFKRQVKQGEKGIKIIAPAPFKTMKDVDRTDADGRPVFDNNGQRVKDQIEVTVPAFKVATVFDVSQTEGEPLPEIGKFNLDGNVERYKELFAAIEKASPVPVAFEPIESGTKGYYHQTEKRIAINEGMSELDTLRVAVHEVVHSRLHARDENAPKDAPRPDRRTREVEAESIAFAVCARYGLDTSDSSFGYIAEWSGDKKLDTLKTSLDTIRKEADAIITEIDKHFTELTQDKQQTAEKSMQEQNASEPQGDTFTIYQLKDGDETRDLRFAALASVTATGLAVALSNYDNIYSAPLDKDTIPEDIYFKFNMNRPEDFKGHSLSVSDVVVMNRDGKDTAYYVDDIGFQELPDFLTPKEQTQEHEKITAEPKGTPLFQEYTALTNEYPDNIVFKRIGDFYEVMGDKAVTVANEQGLAFVLTGRDVGLTERVPMIGVPAHNLDTVIKELTNRNYTVTVADKETITEHKPAPPIALKVVADYMQKQNDIIQAADPNKTQGQAAFNMAVKRLDAANERIPDEHPQLKTLIINAAKSPDLATLKERMNTMHSEFIQHYSTAVQMTLDTSGKAEPKTPAAPVKQGDAPTTTKPPAQGENVAAIEAKIKAGETINLTDLSNAMKKDKQAAQTVPSQNKINPQNKSTAKPQQPSIKEKIAAGKQQLAAQKATPSNISTKNKNAGLGD